MDTHSYRPKTSPRSHQAASFHETADLDAHAFFWEQGTGKSKAMIDTAAYRYLKGDVTGLVVLAPPGVERNWVNDELPAHLPDEVMAESCVHYFASHSSATKWHQQAVNRLLAHKGFAILCISYDAFMTKAGTDAVRKLVKGRPTMVVLDEAQRIKTPTAARTRLVLGMAPHAKVRRIANGTPITNGPFDIYSQLKFLQKDIWKPLGVDNFAAFKARFGEFVENFNSQTGRFYPVLKSYRFLDDLQKYIKPWSSRVLKEDVLDLPPKVYTTRYVQLTPEQKRLYKEIREEFNTTHNGRFVDASLPIVRLLRFQQVICGYLPTVDENGEPEPAQPLPGPNPRLDALLEAVEDHPGKMIIWARFNLDRDLIEAALKPLGKVVRYDGGTSSDDREEAKRLFQKVPVEEGGARFFLASAKAAGRGLTLHAAETVVYYSNTFDLEEREQSEDRAHRDGLRHTVTYVDLVAQDTVDTHILRNLRDKKDVAAQVTGDRLREWIA